MTTIYNVQPAEVDIIVTRGDSINMDFTVDLNGANYSLTGKQLDMKVKKFDGTVVKTLSSVGTSPAITITADAFNITTTAFAEVGTLKYDLQLTVAGAVYTIMKGMVIIKEDITTA
jgi:hypothetical protein